MKFLIYGIFLFSLVETGFGQFWPLTRTFGMQYPIYPTGGLAMADDEYAEPVPVSPISSSYYTPFSSYRKPLGYGGLPFARSNAQDVAMASLISYVYDKDNFHAQGCGWDGGRNRCTDILNQCKGICKDFANDVVTHDCRCVPFGYAALLGWGKK